MGRADSVRGGRDTRRLIARLRRPAGSVSSLRSTFRSTFAACLARLGGAAACLFLLFTAAPAGAQTSVKLVSNTAQAGSNHFFSLTTDLAQAFTTGGNTNGYRLTAVSALVTNSTFIPTYTAHIYRADNQSGLPTGSSLGTFVNPVSLATAGTKTWRAAGGGIDLAANTGYLFVLDVESATASGNPSITATDSDNEDTGAASGWNIDNIAAVRGRGDNQLSGWQRTGHSRVMRIGIHGYAKGANRAPRARRGTGDLATCQEDIEIPAVLLTLSAPTGTEVSINLTSDASLCSVGAHFYDPDGDDLTVTITGVEVESGKTVRFFPGSPRISGNRTTNIRLFLWRASKHSNATVTVSFRVEDPHGASVSSSAKFTGGSWAGTTAPTVADPDDLTLAKGVAMSPVVLPAATGGDLTVTTPSESITLDYDYAVSGLPAGLSFDAATRTVSGTPTATAGDYTVTYEADDADGKSKSRNPAASIPSDTASQQFTITLVDPPAAPTGLSVSQVAANGGHLSVGWTAVTGATDYDLRHCDQNTDADCAGKWIEEGDTIAGNGIPDPGTSTSNIVITGLAAGTAYRVQVRAAKDGVEGPWSASGTATTASSASTNNAPRLLRDAHTANAHCEVNDRADGWITNFNAPGGTLVSLSPLYTRRSTGDTGTFPASCASDFGSYFDDQDVDPLVFSVSSVEVPDNVRLWDNVPRATQADLTDQESNGRLFFRAIAAYRTTLVRVDVTATDPHGASVTGHVNFVTTPYVDRDGAPRFTETVTETKHFAVNTAIDDWVLPAATGGDVTYSRQSTRFSLDHGYAVSGLPPGLAFDPDTRTVSGTPTAAGTYTLTYTADDADEDSANLNPEKSVPADTASQNFTVVVGTLPTIREVWVSSQPSLDTDGDGAPDTYVQGDTIHVMVEFSEPVEATGTPRLRLHMGPDNAGSNRTANLDAVLNGGMTLRFAYTVQSGDTDTDGLWVRTGASNRLVFLPTLGGVAATVVSAVTGEDASLVRAGLPTAGGQLAGTQRSKVDGSKTIADRGPLPVGALVNGATMTVQFDKDLASGFSVGQLQMNLEVQASNVHGGQRTAYQHPSGIERAGNAKVLMLTLGVPVRAGDKVTLSHSFTEGREVLQGTGGKPVAEFRDLEVINETPGTAAAAAKIPVPVRASVAGTGAAPGVRHRAGRGIGACGQRLHGARGRGRRPGGARHRGHGHGGGHRLRGPGDADLGGEAGGAAQPGVLRQALCEPAAVQQRRPGELVR